MGQKSCSRLSHPTAHANFTSSTSRSNGDEPFPFRTHLGYVILLLCVCPNSTSRVQVNDRPLSKISMKLVKQLPDPFVMQNGQRITTVEHWHSRREEVKSMMLNMQYGTMPGPPENVTVQSLAVETLESGSTQTQLHFEFTPQKKAPQITFGEDEAALLVFANWHLFGIHPQINFKALLDDTPEFSACCNWTRPE